MVCRFLVEIGKLFACLRQRCLLPMVRRREANPVFVAPFRCCFGLRTRAETQRGRTPWERCVLGFDRTGPSEHPTRSQSTAGELGLSQKGSSLCRARLSIWSCSPLSAGAGVLRNIFPGKLAGSYAKSLALSCVSLLDGRHSLPFPS